MTTSVKYETVRFVKEVCTFDLPKVPAEEAEDNQQLVADLGAIEDLSIADFKRLARQYPQNPYAAGQLGITPLAIAINRKAAPLIQHLVKAHPQYAAQGAGPTNTPYLVQACQTKDLPFALEVFQLLRSQNVNVNWTSKGGMSALHACLQYDELTFLALLLVHKEGRLYQQARYFDFHSAQLQPLIDKVSTLLAYLEQARSAMQNRPQTTPSKAVAAGASDIIDSDDQIPRHAYALWQANLAKS
ncbi:MAG: hypothetical protein HY069_01520 [Chlamydiia bacterium]|nr:hypothetical protein [Chlamydiia bacterium]